MKVKRILKSVIALIALSLLSCVLTNQRHRAESLCLASEEIYGTSKGSITGKVIHISDGDTLLVLDSKNKKHEIRLAGIDAPEKRQDFGNKAKNFLESQIKGVNLVVNIYSHDSYGREIGVVCSNKSETNSLMIKEGYAWQYRAYNKSKILSNLEKEARQKRKGLWSHKHPVPPWKFRHFNNI